MAAPAIPHDARPAASKAPVKLPVVTNPSRKASTTIKASSDPLFDEAVAQAKASLAAEQAPVQAQQASSDAYFKQRGTDATANASALSELLKGIGPAVQKTYDTAAQNQDLLANGFGDGMKAALTGSTDSLNAILAKLNSPATLDSHATESSDVLKGLGGYIPASSMVREGAGFAAAANMLPATALLRGGENVKAISASGDAAHSAFDDKLAELAGKLPGDVQTNYQNLQKLALDNKKFAEQVKKNQFDQAYKTATQKLNVAKYNTGIDEFNAKQTLNYAKLARQTLQSDRDYAIKLSNLGIRQAADQRAALAAEYKLQNGGYSQKDIDKFNAKLQSGLNDIQTIEHPDGTTTYVRPDPNDKTGKKTLPVTYVDFVKQAVAHGAPPSLAIDRANSFFPPSARPQGPGALDFALGINTTQTGGAAPWTAAKQGKVNVAPNAMRAGGPPLNPVVTSFVGALAGLTGQPLTIGTGTNHNEMTTDGNVSDHWDGNAADIPSSGASLTRLGRKALILAGADPAWARKQTGGLFNIQTPEGRVQIIFNTKQGGNHYTHLHVGISPG